jgi:hypothetical protein
VQVLYYLAAAMELIVVLSDSCALHECIVHPSAILALIAKGEKEEGKEEGEGEKGKGDSPAASLAVGKKKKKKKKKKKEEVTKASSDGEGVGPLVLAVLHTHSHTHSDNGDSPVWVCSVIGDPSVPKGSAVVSASIVAFDAALAKASTLIHTHTVTLTRAMRAVRETKDEKESTVCTVYATPLCEGARLQLTQRGAAGARELIFAETNQQQQQQPVCVRGRGGGGDKECTLSSCVLVRGQPWSLVAVVEPADGDVKKAEAECVWVVALTEDVTRLKFVWPRRASLSDQQLPASVSAFVAFLRDNASSSSSASSSLTHSRTTPSTQSAALEVEGLLVVGSSGIGKSRLLGAFCNTSPFPALHASVLQAGGAGSNALLPVDELRATHVRTALKTAVGLAITSGARECMLVLDDMDAALAAQASSVVLQAVTAILSGDVSTLADHTLGSFACADSPRTPLRVYVVGVVSDERLVPQRLRGRRMFHRLFTPPTGAPSSEVARHVATCFPTATGASVETIARVCEGMSWRNVGRLVAGVLGALRRDPSARLERVLEATSAQVAAQAARMHNDTNRGHDVSRSTAHVAPTAHTLVGYSKERGTLTHAVSHWLDWFAAGRTTHLTPTEHKTLSQLLAPARGVLLHGPSGCGKTSLARNLPALLPNASFSFLSASITDLFSKFLGSSEEKIRELFALAQRHAPCVLFIDQIDMLGESRGGYEGGGGADGSSAFEFRLLSTLLTEMDGMTVNEGVFVLAATNRLQALDDALIRPGRFDKLVHMGVPNGRTRADIFDMHYIHATDHKNSGGREGPPSTLQSVKDEFVECTEGFSCAQVLSLCQSYARQAMRRAVEQKEKATLH